MKTAKAVVAAIGATATAVSTAAATVAVAVGDDRIDVGEIASVTTAIITLALTVWGVWRVPNQPAAGDVGAARPLQR